MPDDAFLARIDAHMERGNEQMVRSNEHMERGNELMVRSNEHMERGNELMERGSVLMVEVREEVRLTREALVDSRTFTQQMIMRLDRMIRDNAKTMDRMGERIDRGIDELERQGVQQREENRAGREALFAMIDRMNRLDPPDARS